MAYCGRCNRHFSFTEALHQHQRDSSMHWFCEDCDQDFDDNEDLETHYMEDHHYCSSCSLTFDTEKQRRKHMNKQHWWCSSCDRTFQSENNLDHHLRSSTHQPKRFGCPGCTKAFISSSALILHCESGSCPSGVTRQAVNRLVLALDRNNVITNPGRLLEGSVGSYVLPSTTITSWATGRSWNGSAYECVLCHREFGTLNGLNSHLQSPAHADKIYLCPTGWSVNGCGSQFRTLSGLVQHVESGACGVKRFRNQIDDVVGAVAGFMKSLTL